MLGEKGYTVVELVTVLTVLGMLGSAAVPKTVHLDKVYSIVCRYQARQVETAAQLYYLEYSQYPDTVEQLVPEFFLEFPKCSSGKGDFKIDDYGRVGCDIHQ